MRVCLVIWLLAELPVEDKVRTRIMGPLDLEALSPPPKGEVAFFERQSALCLELRSEEASTLRAMWNSYMGLVSAALRTAA
jgi:tRNA threonylcarbamoyladenosine modification (KEOPS) complex  Pcc1 subunit